MLKKLILITVTLLVCLCGYGQDSSIAPQVRTSPTMIANLLTSKNQYIKVTYGQPFKKGRKVFGNLVPYNQLWRTGANESTEITVSVPFLIGQNYFSSGTYALFSVPNPQEWEIIINKRPGQWGTFSYNPSDDLLHFKVPAQTIKDSYEAFTIEVRESKPEEVRLKIYWESMLIEIPITFPESHIPQAPSKRRKRAKAGSG